MSRIWSQLLFPNVSVVCLPGYTKVEDYFSIVKCQFWACFYKSVGLLRLKTHGMVIKGPLGFHSRIVGLMAFKTVYKRNKYFNNFDFKFS